MKEEKDTLMPSEMLPSGTHVVRQEISDPLVVIVVPTYNEAANCKMRIAVILG